MKMEVNDDDSNHVTYMYVVVGVLSLQRHPYVGNQTSTISHCVLWHKVWANEMDTLNITVELLEADKIVLLTRNSTGQYCGFLIERPAKIKRSSVCGVCIAIGSSSVKSKQ